MPLLIAGWERTIIDIEILVFCNRNQPEGHPAVLLICFLELATGGITEIFAICRRNLVGSRSNFCFKIGLK